MAQDDYRTRITTAPGGIGTLQLGPQAYIDPRDQRYVHDAYQWFLNQQGGGTGGGQDAATIPATPAAPAAPIGGGGGGGGITAASAAQNMGGVNTPFEQNLLDQGVEVQIAPGQPVVAPGEMPVTQEEMDAFNQIPVNTDYRNQQLVNQGIGVRVEDGPVMDPGSGLYTQADIDAFNQTPGSNVTPMDPTQMIPQISTYTPRQTIAGDVYAAGDYSDVAGTLGDPLE